MSWVNSTVLLERFGAKRQNTPKVLFFSTLERGISFNQGSQFYQSHNLYLEYLVKNANMFCEPQEELCCVFSLAVRDRSQDTEFILDNSTSVGTVLPLDSAKRSNHILNR